jgi:catechol 2,3-dioxygenase-like lactoylglutathione lyase family enzyme
VIGIGGLFLRGADIDASQRWYREVLGLSLEIWGRIKFEYSRRRYATLGLFPASTTQFRAFEVARDGKFIVVDLNAVLAHAATMGASPIGRDDADLNGGFAWLDPDDFKIELWEPAAAS